MFDYHTILSFLNSYGYLTIFLVIFCAELGLALPVPSEVLLIYAGYRVYLGKLSPVGVIASGFLGDFLGSVTLFFILYYIGEKLFQKITTKIHVDEKKIAAIQGAVSSRGSLYIFVGRFIPFFRLYITITCGLLKFKPKKFTVISASVSFIWATVLTIIGIKTGPAFIKIIDKVSIFKSIPTGLPILLFLIILLVCYNLLTRTHKSKRLGVVIRKNMEKVKGNRWVTLVIIAIGFLMILIDTTVVNVAIPTIIKDLHTSLSDIEWIITGYGLSFAALLITFGRLGDVYGRKKLFILGLVVFTIASFFSGEASNASILIIARLCQGVGGAMLSPATLSILSSNFTGRQRSLAFGIWGAVAGIAVAVGPVLGGFLTSYYNWRWIFRVNIPIGILGIIAAMYFVSESKAKEKQTLDISGMITSTIGFFFLVFALIEGQIYGWITPSGTSFSIGGFSWTNTSISIIPLCFILSTVFLILFIIIQVIKTKKKLAPAVDINFFQSKAFRYGLVAIGVIALGEFSSLFTVPIFLQSLKGFTPLQSGYAVLPLAIASFIAAPLSAQLVNKVGTKIIITTGITLEFVGLFLLGRLTAQTEYSSLILPFIILGTGIGFALAQNTQVILSDIEPGKSGSASGILNTVRQVGSALGIAIIGAVLSSQMNSNLISRVNQINGLPKAAKQQIISQASSGGIAGPAQATPSTSITPPVQIAHNPIALKAYYAKEKDIGNEITSAIDNSLASAIATSIKVGSFFVLIGAVLSLLIPNIKQKRKE